MKKKEERLIEERLAALLNEEAMDTPSVELSEKLLQLSINNYQLRYQTRYKKEERLGKAIIAILLFFNGMMLYLLKPFTFDVLSLLVFIILLSGLVFLIRKNIGLLRAIRTTQLD